MIDPTLVKRAHDKIYFREEMVEQVLSLMSVLKMISEDPTLGKRFVLIGGTAINLSDPKIPRLSVDIDLDYFQNEESPVEQGLIKKHSVILERIAKALDMDYFESPNKANSYRLGAVLHYKANFKPAGEGEVKLDISYLLKSTIFPPAHRRIRQLHPDDGFRDLKFLTAHPCELWAGKALALVYRSEKDPKPKEAADLYSMFISRHLYDVSRIERILKKRPKLLDQKRLQNAFILKGVTRMRELFHLRGSQLRKCSEREVQQELYPYLREEDHPPLEEMKRLSREFLDRVCSNVWDERQKAFVEVFEKGEYKPEILFGNNNSEYAHLYHNEYLHRSARIVAK